MSAPPAGPAAERVFVGLGANLGDTRAAIEHALAEMAALPDTQLLRWSSCWLSAPVGAQGPDYANAVAELRTGLEPADLLHALLAIEKGYGRERPYPNAPRVLDLDLLLYGHRRITLPQLTVPHPRLHERAFVLLPLAELDAELQVPGIARVGDLLDGVRSQRALRAGPLRGRRPGDDRPATAW